MKKPWELDHQEAEAPHEAPGSSEKQVPSREAKETDHLLSGPNVGLWDYLGYVQNGVWEASKDGLGLVPYIVSLQEHFGYKLLVLLFVCQHCLKGFTTTFSGQAVAYLYASYNVPAPQVQIFGGVTQLPWSMKPIIGLLSDILPIAGYNKAPYMLITAALGAAAVLYVGLVPASMLPVSFVVMGLFLLSLQLSTCDLLSEAKYAEKMALAPSHGPALMSYVWAGLAAGGLVAVLLSGPVIDHGGPKLVYCIVAIPLLLLFVPVLMGYLEEQKVTPEELQRARGVFYRQKEACFLCILMLVGSIAIIGAGLRYSSPVINCAVSCSVAVVMLIAFSLVLSPVIAKFNAFSLIYSSLSLSISGATFYFYTNTAEKYKAGPHFTPYFFNSTVGTVGQLMSLFGIVLYQKYFSTWKYRHLLIMTNIIASALALLDVAMFARLNVKWGIPDEHFVLGLSVFEVIIQQWMWMPQVVILSFLCPKGMEATMYALLAGCHNLGNTISSNSGALLLQLLGCQPNGSVGEDAQFENLWKAALVASAFPLFSLLALYPLIPDAYQNEKLVGDNIADATAGSLWKRLTSHDESRHEA
mmetsp:Transcript_44487/g.81241  ORF Transcript_44487/g.81241 Transcript_44487/m.81241 type:complete len:584 (+) Transcript_44487:150-1901(+)